MSELIDREALLDECLNHYEVGNIEQNCTMDWICKTVRNLPAAPRWHRVEEPPKKDGKYLVCWKDGGGFCYDTAWWTSVGTWSLSHWTGVTVTHWMTVEPPKEEQNDNNKM